jgi:hypothetical protein
VSCRDTSAIKRFVYGTGLDTIQGGDPAGCPAPQGEPRGVHLNLTVVPVGTQGNVRVYPANVATPGASAVNFKLGTNIANALTVQTFYDLASEEIQVFVGGAARLTSWPTCWATTTMQQ